MLGGSHGVSDLVRTGTSGARKKERPEKRPAPGVYVHTLRMINIQQRGTFVEGFVLDAASHVQLPLILKCAVSPGGNGMQHVLMHILEFKHCVRACGRADQGGGLTVRSRAALDGLSSTACRGDPRIPID